MKIRKITVSSNFRYLWLKEVVGVDLSVHCARSLLGNYDNRISSSTKTATDIELKGSLYYLCGVSSPYVWEHNFHLAFERREGEILCVSKNGISIEIEGAAQIDFSEHDVDLSLTQSKKKEFYTCRNWQFANKIAKIYANRQNEKEKI